MEEVVVTGSFIKRTTADSPSPLSVVSRADIENIGAVEISDIVNRMTYNSGSTNSNNSFSGGDNSSGETNINLRNLGLGSTLVLLNGRRALAGNNDAGGNAYVNTAILTPTIAIERVEVVKDGSSALYGSDAVAGVVNFITRDDFEGAEVQVRYSSDQETWKQDDATVAAIWGASGERGSIVVSAEYLDRQPLKIDDRWDDYGRSGVSTLGNPSTFTSRSTVAAERTAYLLGGGAYMGFESPTAIAGDIDCELAASMSRQSFRAPTRGTPYAGTLDGLGACIYDFSPLFELVGREQRFLTLASGHYDITDTLETYFEVGYSDQDFVTGQSLYPMVRFPVVPANNPGLINDFRRRSLALTDGANASFIPAAPLTLYGRMLGFGPDQGPGSFERPVDTESRQFVEQSRVVTGLQGDLPFGNNWSFDASFTYSERDSQARITDTKQQQMLLALNGRGGPNCDLVAGTPGVGGCKFWNPFFSGYFNPDGSRQTDPTLANTPELLNWMVGEVRSVAENKLTVVDLVMSGDLMELPSGALGMAVGAQFRREQVFFDADRDSNLNNYSFIYGAADFGAQENVAAAFVEFAVPVTDRLELQIAGRMEDFDRTDETTFDPKITAMFSASDSLTLRASAGTSFRVGSLLQREGQSTQLINIADPFSGTGLAFRPQIGFGNPDLKPEESTAWNLGLSWAPVDGPLEGLSVDFDYYNYNYDDLITLEGPVDLVTRDTQLRCPQGLNNVTTDAIPDCGLQTNGTVISIGEGIPDQVIRDPSNLSLLRVSPTYSNAQELDVSGMDFTIGYRWELGNLGMLNPALTGSWAREWDLTRADGSKLDGVGSRNFGTTIGRSLPEWKLNLSLNWIKERHSAFMLVRYIDSYDDNQAIDDPGLDGKFVCLGSCLRAFSAGQFSNVAETVDEIDRHISSWTTVDAQYTYELPAIGIMGEGSSVSVGGYNIFNRKPPRINFDGQFDPFVHDSRGAVWYARYTMNL